MALEGGGRGARGGAPGSPPPPASSHLSSHLLAKTVNGRKFLRFVRAQVFLTFVDDDRLLLPGSQVLRRIMRWESFPLWVLLLTGSRCSGGYRSQFEPCRDTDLVLYSLVFETHWTRQLFPKQYPENRPPAHWSKMIGMTHDENYVLFRIGEMADKEFKTFAETGKTEVLGGQRRVHHVLDEFSSSSIKTGAGRTQVNFFVDGNHSLVSVAVKIIPSPDWFVGVDSLALCVEGNWLDSITIEASPIDAGTDSGFTFTAPNWETEPQERISKITSTWPKHPANSFYYPKLRDLPVIATFHMAKKKLYQLKRKVDVEERRTENATETPPRKSVFFLDNSLSANRSKYKKYKRQKLKKHGKVRERGTGKG